MKKFLKSFLALALTGGMFAFTGCKDYEADINSLGDRVTALEGTVADLKSQIESGKIITGVESTANGVKVTMSDGSTFELKNGQDGQDGAPGQDGTPGSVVEIGANGNWLIDGVDTGKPSKGADGQDGQPGQDGQDGQDATQIYYKPGADGFWIKVTIEPGKEPVEEPTEDSWVAPGTLTAVWDTEDGTLTFANVEGSEEPIVINLTTLLKSLAFVPEVMAQGLGVIDFYSIYDIEDVFAASNQPKVTYRLNPQNADVKDVAWSFINRNVTTKVAGDKADAIEIVSYEAGKEGGMVFELSADSENFPTDVTVKGEQILVALQAAGKYGDAIVSDYALVGNTKLEDFEIVNKEDYYAEPSVVTAYPLTEPAVADMANLTMRYDLTLNVNEYLETYEYTLVQKALPEIYVYPEYNVKLIDEYLGQDNTTDQQQFVKLEEVDGEYILSVADGLSRSAIGRTPVLFVQSMIGDQIIAEAYIKVKIVDEEYSEVPKEEETFVTLTEAYEYTEIDTEVADELPWMQVNTDILEKLGLTYTEFAAKYDLANPAVYYKVGDGQFVESPATTGITVSAEFENHETATNAVTVTLDNTIDENTNGAVKVVLQPNDEYQDTPVAIIFNYTVSHIHVWPEFSEYYLIPNTDDIIQVKGKLVSDDWTMVSTIKEHFVDYLDGYTDETNHGALTFWLPALDAKGAPISKGATGGTAQDGASVTGTDWNDQTIQLTAPLDDEYKDYIVGMYNLLANGNYCEKFYTVRFVSPFVVTADPVTLKTFAATPDSADLNEYVVIKDRDGKVVYENGAATEYATATYKLETADFNVTYAIDPSAEFGEGLLTLSSNVLTWDNEGTDLQKDMSTNYTVTVSISTICNLEKVGEITVLSTANSKE